MAPKGEFEVEYFGGPNNPAPCGGVNYSAPYTAIPPNDLAPGSVNTQNINGFLCSSPWVAIGPWPSFTGTGEYMLGSFEVQGYGQYFPFAFSPAAASNISIVLIVTTVAVYATTAWPSLQSSQMQTQPLTLLHTWSAGEINAGGLFPGQAISFVQIGSFVYFTGLMLNGIFWFNTTFSPAAFGQATNYVSARWIAELAGRVVVSECRFPGGGGTGTAVMPTVAWSGVGIFGQAWDLNPAHDVWNPLNQAFFSGNIGGFNLLGDVPDQITGMGTVGQSIIIVRLNGLTQQDPNSTYSNSGIQPFNWYHMWSSSQGVGGLAGSVAQFGQTLNFRSSDNVYSLSMTAGLTPLGNKVIAKIIADQIAIENSPGIIAAGGASPTLNTFFLNSWWHFSSLYNLDGQLHYLLTLSSYLTNPSSTPASQITNTVAYDLNMADGSWHFWDFSQYATQGGSGAGFIGISCPPVLMAPTYSPVPNTGVDVQTTSNPRFFLAGIFTGYGTLSSPVLTGQPILMVPFDYDSTSNPIGNYIALLYQVQAVPSTKIIFRAETLSLGHKISTRRLRIQADNAPFPVTVANRLAQAQVTVQGSGEKNIAVSPSISMKGDAPITGLPIKTYYGDVVLSDEMVQPSLASLNNTWQSLCPFRIASASLIGIDTTGTTP